ncbi:hypothetical protein QE152_g32037 [Popillia japonica]|uniref:Uncharacterized protein n=1 Tax=Popillia japonica TaxID=7064 RepID=A0AAW1J0Z8_POPJA
MMPRNRARKSQIGLISEDDMKATVMPVLRKRSDEVGILSDVSEDGNDSQKVEVKGFVLVKFATNETVKYFVGQVETIVDPNEMIVNFLRNVNNKFVFANVKDEAAISREDIVRVLPLPMTTGGTARLKSTYQFNVDFSSYNVM